jgi:hypothetical protein
MAATSTTQSKNDKALIAFVFFILHFSNLIYYPTKRMARASRQRPTDCAKRIFRLGAFAFHLLGICQWLVPDLRHRAEKHFSRFTATGSCRNFTCFPVWTF